MKNGALGSSGTAVLAYYNYCAYGCIYRQYNTCIQILLSLDWMCSSFNSRFWSNKFLLCSCIAIRLFHLNLIRMFSTPRNPPASNSMLLNRTPHDRDMTGNKLYGAHATLSAFYHLQRMSYAHIYIHCSRFTIVGVCIIFLSNFIGIHFYRELHFYVLFSVAKSGAASNQNTKNRRPLSR